MVNLKTGKSFQDACDGIHAVDTPNYITRRSALKGGLAAILAAGVAPSLCGSITRGIGYRNLAGRLAAMSGGKSGWVNPYDTTNLVLLWDAQGQIAGGLTDAFWQNITVGGAGTLTQNGLDVLNATSSSVGGTFASTPNNMACIEVAINISNVSTDISKSFKIPLKSNCGLFVTRSYNGIWTQHQGATSYWVGKHSVSPSTVVTFTIDYSGNKIYSNGVLCSVGSWLTNVGGWGNLNAVGTNGSARVCSIRAYSSMISTATMTANRNADLRYT